MLDTVSAQVYREALQQWRGKVAWATLVAASVLVILFAGGITLALFGIIPLWAGAIAVFLAAHAGFTVLHEACHRTISGEAPGMRWLDPLFGTVHAAILLYDFPTFRFLHQRHHTFTNDPASDPDYWMQRHSALAVALRAPFVPLHYLRLYILAAREGQVKRQELVSAFVRIGALLAVMLTLLVLAPVQTFVLWILPASLATILISLSHRMLHVAEQSTDRRRTTRVITGERIWEWIICPFFWLNNHHLVHHESPRLPVQSHPGVFHRIEGALEASGARIVRFGSRPHE